MTVGPPPETASQSPEPPATTVESRPENRALHIDKAPRDLYDWLMFSVGLAGVAAVVATIWISRGDEASNARDVQAAITKMAAIAQAMKDEKPLLEKQANGAAASAEAAELTAHLVKSQTDATIIQANALIKSAGATVRATTVQLSAAQAQLASAQANTKAAEAGARAAEMQRLAAIQFSASRIPIAKLAFVQFDSIGPPGSDGMIEIGAKPTFTNVGGGSLLAGIATFNLTIAITIPTSPPVSNQYTFGGNENAVSPGGQYSPAKALEIRVSKADWDAASSGKKNIIVWGKALFADVSGKQYRVCYIDTVRAPTSSDAGGSVRALEISGYECGNP